LPRKPTVVWQQALEAPCLAGIAATKDYVIVGDRETMDTTDAWKCLKAADGKEVWSVRTLAGGNLDYGNSSRSTPLIWNDLVFLANAFGNVQCVELATGKSVWDLDTREKFGAKDERKWGTCASPLIVDDKLIINPGGKDASLVALEPKTGKMIWQTPGKAASYGSFFAGTFGGKKQVIGWDVDSLGGWDAANGKRLWTYTPAKKSAFNVPTIVPVGEQILVAIENNGSYLFRFDDKGALDPKPVAHYEDLAPDTHTPTLANGRIFGVWNGLHVLDTANKLKLVYRSDDNDYSTYTTVVATDERVLAMTLTGELILLDAKTDKLKELGRLALLEDERGCYSHPAFVGTRMYLRTNTGIQCIDLAK